MEALMQPLPESAMRLSGLSEALIASHHANNYGGAVRRLNAIRAELAATSPAALPGFRLNGLKREELIAANSMLLHELYFGALGGDGAPLDPAWAMALQASFGSVERWREEFIAMGRALAGGSGWVMLVFQPRDGSMSNQWAADHTHCLAGGVPLLVLDMYEHAYHIDHGANAAAYVDAFMANVDFGVVYGRYQRAVYAATEGLACAPDDLGSARLIDVRRAGAYEQASHVIAGATWRDPARVRNWASDLDAADPVVAYCVYGKEVCRATVLRLRAAGVDARFLSGGIDAWQAAGRPLADKPAG
jgi:Fe-Mn family superoxide dismutase